MTDETKPSRGMPRAILYALIPLGFIALVGIMILAGEDEDLAEGGATPVVTE